MKKFQITVNGKSYEVEVEEIGGGSAPAARPAAAPAPAQAAPAPAAPKAAAPAPAGASVVTAPMPGKILSIKAKVGQQVNDGDMLLTLEAMKMENEIFAESAGTVKEIRVSEGSTVDSDEVLVVIG